jgi:hypothetical protein
MVRTYSLINRYTGHPVSQGTCLILVIKRDSSHVQPWLLPCDESDQRSVFSYPNDAVAIYWVTSFLSFETGLWISLHAGAGVTRGVVPTAMG